MAEQVVFNINTEASVAMIHKLEALHKSAMPLAIRGTLNSAAFDVKQRTLDESATQNFVRRSPTFFKRFSGVNRATGYNIGSMRAEVGMTANGDQKAQTAINNMQKQETGGHITEGLDYLSKARIGGNLDRAVAVKKRWDKDNIISGPFTHKGRRKNAIPLKGGTSKSRAVNSAYMALKFGKFQKIKLNNGRNAYRIVTSISKSSKGKLKINSKLIYVERNGNIKPVTATHFSKEAADRTVPRITQFFYASAQRQIDRVWK